MTEVDYPASWYAATRDANETRAPLAREEEAEIGRASCRERV